jgi:regulator of protease activity HflC (stomatin/prohibitin superfamily)
MEGDNKKNLFKFIERGFKKNMKNINKEDLPDIKMIVIGVICFILIVSIFNCVYTIKAGERGVLLTFGKPSMDSVQEGLHFKFPFFQRIKKLEVRTKKIETEASAASKDLQDVQTTIALNYHLSPNEVPKLYQKIGLSYEERIISPVIQESVKAVQAKFTAEELVTKRPEVRRGIQETLTERLSKSYIIVDDFNIVNFKFSDGFVKAIEEKVTAEQLKLKAERDLERIKIEKEQAITKAEAEAQALKIQKSEVTPGLIKLRQIEVQKIAVEKWDGKLPMVTGGSIPMIEISNLQNKTL